MLDPTIYKDWQIAEEAEKTLPSVDEFRKMMGLLPEEIIPYGKTPKLDFERLKDIHAAIDTPLVLHGGSGTPVDQLHAAIKLGIAKINICTDIHKAFLRGMEEAKASRTPSVPGNYYIPACEAMFEKTVEMIKLFSEIK